MVQLTSYQPPVLSSAQFSPVPPLGSPGRHARYADNEPSDHASEDKCKVCGEDEYQPLAGQKSCEDCPGNRVIEDRKDPDKHINASQCYEKGAVAPCSAGEGRSLEEDGQETDCRGTRSMNVRHLSCVLRCCFGSLTLFSGGFLLFAFLCFSSSLQRREVLPRQY